MQISLCKFMQNNHYDKRKLIYTIHKSLFVIFPIKFKQGFILQCYWVFLFLSTHMCNILYIPRKLRCYEHINIKIMFVRCM